MRSIFGEGSLPGYRGMTPPRNSLRLALRKFRPSLKGRVEHRVNPNESFSSSMPWNNQNGNSGGPWGRGPSSGGPSGSGGGPPDLEELLRRARQRWRNVMSGGEMAAGGIAIAALVVVGLWLASGVYVVHPYEQGVVLRFGKFVERTGSGLHYHLPWPVETAYTPDVTSQRQISRFHRNLIPRPTTTNISSISTTTSTGNSTSKALAMDDLSSSLSGGMTP